jgi:DHA1 family inner membrane transport protein
LWLVTAVVLLVGTGVAIMPALQIRLMDVAEDAQTLAAALNHSAFNIANAPRGVERPYATRASSCVESAR